MSQKGGRCCDCPKLPVRAIHTPLIRDLEQGAMEHPGRGARQYANPGRRRPSGRVASFGRLRREPH